MQAYAKVLRLPADKCCGLIAHGGCKGLQPNRKDPMSVFKTD